MTQAARMGSQSKPVVPLHGDIWKLRGPDDWVVVPTNIGYKGKAERPIAVMGRGLAVQAARFYPNLPAWYGALCHTHGADTPVVPYEPGRLILFPTKALYVPAPNRSWAQPADLALIEDRLRGLDRLLQTNPRFQRVLVPLLGCGNGGLEPTRVRYALDPYIAASKGRLVLVLPP